MGGFVPLGYDARDRKLVVNEAEAALVLPHLRGLRRTGLRHQAGSHPTCRGRHHETRPHLLQERRLPGAEQPHYLGEAMHKGTSHPGEHQAVVSQAQWDAVHALLTVSPRVRANRTRCQPRPCCGG
jgi:hypothetical protein